MKRSCGAILYAFNPEGKLGIILGDESNNHTSDWLPFKGGCQENETLEQTAIREIFEETCGLILIDDIELHHKFATKRKEYHIGLIEVPYELLKTFPLAKENETRENFMEKKALKFFPYPDILKDTSVHNISKSSILFYKDTLDAIAESGKSCSMERCSRYLGISDMKAESLKQKNPKTNSKVSPEDKQSKLSQKNHRSARPNAQKKIPTNKSYTMYRTPRTEKMFDQSRVWR